MGGRLEWDSPLGLVDQLMLRGGGDTVSDHFKHSANQGILGGISSIRGFKDQSLSGDNGGYWRNQLCWTKPIYTSWLQPIIQQYGLKHSPMTKALSAKTSTMAITTADCPATRWS